MEGKAAGASNGKWKGEKKRKRFTTSSGDDSDDEDRPVLAELQASIDAFNQKVSTLLDDGPLLASWFKLLIKRFRSLWCVRASCIPAYAGV